MKNIWLINNYAYPPKTSNWTRHYDLMKKMSSESYYFDVVCDSYIHDRKMQMDIKNTKLRYSNINYHVLSGISYTGNKLRILSMLIFSLKLIFFPKKKMKKPNIIFYSTPHLFGGISAWLLAKRYKAKFILEVRDLWPKTWIDMGIAKESSLIMKLFFLIEKFLYVKADKIIILGPGMKDYISKITSKSKVVYISNGVDLTKFDYNKRKKPLIKLNNNIFNLLYTGSLGKANEIETMLESAKLLNNEYGKKIMFNIVGDGPEKEKIKNYIRINELKNVKLYDAVGKEEIPSLLVQADVLLFPIKNIRLYKEIGISPNKIYEYLAAEKTILFAGNPYNDIVKEAKAGITVKPENYEEFSNAIVNLYRKNDLEFGKNGRRFVEKNFTTEILGMKVEEAINS